MTTPPFTRPPVDWRMNFAGLKTNSAPDTLAPDKYALATNVRSYSNSSIRTRPGQLLKFAASSGAAILALRGFLGQANASGVISETPRLLAVDSASKVYRDDGVQAGTLAAPSPALGFSMIPFRPSASPVPWMYVASFGDYQKFSAPTPANVITQAKAGIAEPQTAPDSGIIAPGFTNISGVAANYAAAGTAGAPTNAVGGIASETITQVIADPVGLNVWSVGISGYGGVSTFGFAQAVTSGATQYSVQDWINPNVTGATIAAIQYYAGATGRCAIVPSGLGNSSGVPSFSGNDPTLASVFTQNNVPVIRRGTLLQIDSEVVYVLAVVQGPNGQISIETSTTIAHAAAAPLAIIPTLIVASASGVPPTPGNTVVCNAILSTTSGAGVATLSRTASVFSGLNLGSTGMQDDDLICIFLHSSVANGFTEIRVLFDVGDGSFATNYLMYSISPDAITPALSGAATLLGDVQLAAQQSGIQDSIPGAGQPLAPGGWFTPIVFPISAMVRVGDNGNSVASTVAVQIWVNAASAMQLGFGSITVLGGSQPDVGDAGSPYFYRVRPRASTTGVVGNPSPATRYGVSPRREEVRVTLPSPAYDPQIDTWDVFRYGGTVTSWRFIGSAPFTSTALTDNYDDDAATGGDALDFDNFEPWPSVDQPNNGTASAVSGHIALITSTDPDIVSYLPGTLVIIGGQNAYTLWARPTLVTGTTYLLQFVESAGFGTALPYQINEPFLANRHLPYVFGPDANGTVFGCGDLYRPGTLSFAKSYAPDSVPDSYNLEITPPSEPLLGGEVIDGLALVVSPERWWALNFQPDNSSQRYSVIQQPWPRGLAAPFGHCSDGQSIYWWAKDGIWSSAKGSLTDADLYNLFPHEGVPGVAVTYGGVTIQPPDYSRAASFRLAHVNGYLYATYRDTTGDGTYHTLVLNLRTMAWSLDDYTPQVSVVYHPEQEAGSVQVAGGPFSELVTGNRSGQVASESDGANDLGAPIASALARAEFDGGDARAPKQWGDLFVDLTPAAFAGVVVTPMSLGAGAVPPQTIPAAATRSRLPLNLGGVYVADFLGLLFQWTDDYTRQAVATTLFLSQPSYAVQPARALGWKTFGGSFGLQGYGHIPQIVMAWVSTAPITITPTMFDGLSAAPFVIPSSGGAYQKALFRLSPNKGLLFQFQATSIAPFQLWLDDSELWVGAWSRQTPYLRSRDFGTVVQAGGAV